jgi:hypothetical protein
MGVPSFTQLGCPDFDGAGFLDSLCPNRICGTSNLDDDHLLSVGVACPPTAHSHFVNRWLNAEGRTLSPHRTFENAAKICKQFPSIL